MMETAAAMDGQFQLGNLEREKHTRGVKIGRDWNTFDLAFLHQFEPNMHPLLPEICWNKVEDWEIKWEKIKARLNLSQQQQQQSQIAQETTQSQSSTEQEIAVVSAAAEIQEKIEVKGDSDPSSTHHFIICPESQAEIEFEIPEQHLNSASKEKAEVDTVLDSTSTDLEAVDSDEGEEAISSGGTTASCNGTRRTTNSGAEVGAGAEEAVVTDLDRGTSNGDDDMAAKGEQRVLMKGAASMLGGGPRAQVVCRTMLLNPPPLIEAVFHWDRAARTEPTADRHDGGGGMVQWRSLSLSLSSFGHGGKEGKRLPSTALSPTAMLRGAPPAMNQERDDYSYGC
ncbi:hypothetical protein PIB30_090903 [Stylosanthes scabra]|uniref:Uncharacterized protein n=1 Tax=Stylosanthes scabra TaxID=79078 RepID=A0ABU6RVC4_9FABA|nr:hypothetical protein [Stylosanthes scabra]